MNSPPFRSETSTNTIGMVRIVFRNRPRNISTTGQSDHPPQLTKRPSKCRKADHGFGIGDRIAVSTPIRRARSAWCASAPRGHIATRPPTNKNIFPRPHDALQRLWARE